MSGAESQATFEAGPQDRFTEWLRDRTGEDWAAATEHPFTRDLAWGDLADERFREYIVQDYQFLAALGDLIGHAAGQAPTLAAKAELADFLTTLAGPENDYFDRAFDALDVPRERRENPELRPVTRAFDDLLRRAAREGNYAESLAVLVPVEWVYLEWASAVDGEPDAFYLREWIGLHDNADFRAFVTWLREQLDTTGPELSPRRQRRVGTLFERAVELEVAFFDEF